MICGVYKGWPGLLVNCENCQSLIAYTPSDIQPIPAINGKGFVCPYCKAYVKVELEGE